MAEKMYLDLKQPVRGMEQGVKGILKPRSNFDEIATSTKWN